MFNKIVANFTILIIGLYLYVVCLLNIYRYAQTSESNLILNWLAKRRLVAVHILIVVCFACLVTIPLNKELVSESELKDLYRNNSPIIYQYIQTKGMIGIKTIPMISLFAAAICIGLFFIICSLCTILSYRNLKRMKPRLTAKTYRLFRKLSDVLLIEEIIYLLCGGLPLTVLGPIFLFYPYYFNIISPFCILILYLFPSLSILITLIYIEPYKR